MKVHPFSDLFLVYINIKPTQIYGSLTRFKKRNITEFWSY